MGWGRTLFDGSKALRGGGEWYESIYVWGQGIVNVSAVGSAAFYVGFYARPDFDRIKRVNPVRWPFIVGTGRLTQLQRFTIPAAGEYVLVVRVTSWAPQGGTVRVRVELE